MTQPVPIREGVIPEIDLEREMVDYLQLQMRRYREGAGVPATRIAVVLSGRGDDDKLHSRTNTWDTEEKSTRIENASFASACLMRRAMGDA